MNIYEKMSAITAELSAVAKNLTVGEGKNAYKAAGEADVLAAVKPLEAKHGVYSYPCSRQILETDIMTTTKTYNGNTTETQKLFMRIETVYRFVNIEKPDEYIDIATYGDGVDSQDKAPGKAMTYADKYALMKAYKIITGDDPDQNGSEEGRFKKKPTKQTKPATKPPAEPLATEAEKQIFFDRCKQLGVDYRAIGKQAGATSMADMTAEQQGRALIILKDIESEQK